MLGWFKNWWERTMVMEMTKHCNDGSWESGFYSDDAGIRSVATDQPSAEIIKHPDHDRLVYHGYISPNLVHSIDLKDREHAYTMLNSELDRKVFRDSEL